RQNHPETLIRQAYMQRIHLVGYAALLVLAWAGCDAFTSDAPDAIELKRAPADTTLRTDDAPLVIDMDTLFHSTSDHRLLFEVRADGDAVQIAQQFNQVTITPATRGFSEITLAASTRDGGRQESRFTVRVECATDPGSRFASYFPAASHAQWRFTYTEYHYGFLVPSRVRMEGVLTWNLSSVQDHCQTADFVIEEAFEGIRYASYPDLYDSTYAFSWSNHRSGHLAGDRLVIQGYSDGTYPGLDSLQWLYPASGPDLVRWDSTLSCGGGGCTTAGFEMERDLGLTSFSYASNHHFVDAIHLTLIR
ncbi:MAG: hypothetical protein R2834_23640, partial [Rhodothermales bacterium]